MIINNNLHLTYCTNTHAEKSWEQLFDSIKSVLGEVKASVCPDNPFGIGLRLSDYTSKELLEENNLLKLKDWLKEHNMYVFTMNGFPYGIFHNKVVKDDVHKPDWTTTERVEYTKRLCRILSVLLPKGMEGGISTSPLSYKPWIGDDNKKLKFTYKNAAVNLAMVVEEMVNIRRDSGKILHLDIEPEPDGLIENAVETVHFFKNELLKWGAEYLIKKLSVSQEVAEQMIRTHIRICYDICHFALAYENHEDCFELFAREGIKIGKVQISSALKVNFSEDKEENKSILAELSKFNDKTYLHQVVEKDYNNKITQYRDLPQAMEEAADIVNKEWRTHFHVPVFMDTYGKLKSTQEDVRKVLDILKEKKYTDHLEVETYTWEVLPADLKTDLHVSIVRELEWVLNYLEVVIPANE